MDLIGKQKNEFFSFTSFKGLIIHYFLFFFVNGVIEMKLLFYKS